MADLSGQFGSAEPLPLRETIARAVYAERPYTIAESGGVMEPLREARTVQWEDAPDWYRGECYDLADGIASRLILIAAEASAAAANREIGGGPREQLDDEALRAELDRRMKARWGASKQIAFDAGVCGGTLFHIRSGRTAMQDSVAAAIGYRRVSYWVRDTVLQDALSVAAGAGAQPAGMCGCGRHKETA